MVAVRVGTHLNDHAHHHAPSRHNNELYPVPLPPAKIRQALRSRINVLTWYYSHGLSMRGRAAAQRYAFITTAGYILSPPSGSPAGYVTAARSRALW